MILLTIYGGMLKINLNMTKNMLLLQIFVKIWPNNKKYSKYAFIWPIKTVLSRTEKLETCRNYLRHGKTGQIKNMTCHKNPSPIYELWFYEGYITNVKINLNMTKKYAIIQIFVKIWPNDKT